MTSDGKMTTEEHAMTHDELLAAIDAVLPRVPEFVGWYDRAGDAEPAHTPTASAPCPICWRPVGPKESAKWTSLMYPGARRAFFYAMHPECSALGDCDARKIADAAVLDWSEIQ